MTTALARRLKKLEDIYAQELASLVTRTFRWIDPFTGEVTLEEKFHLAPPP